MIRDAVHVEPLGSVHGSHPIITMSIEAYHAALNDRREWLASDERKRWLDEEKDQ